MPKESDICDETKEKEIEEKRMRRRERDHNGVWI